MDLLQTQSMDEVCNETGVLLNVIVVFVFVFYFVFVFVIHHLDEVCNKTGVSPDQRRASHPDSSPNPAIGSRCLLLEKIFVSRIPMLRTMTTQP